MADETQIHRDIGRLEGQITALRDRVGDLERRNEAAFAELQKSLDAINQKLTESALVDASRVGNFKGAWWIISGLLAIPGIFGAVITWAINNHTNP